MAENNQSRLSRDLLDYPALILAGAQKSVRAKAIQNNELIWLSEHELIWPPDHDMHKATDTPTIYTQRRSHKNHARSGQVPSWLATA